jgi:ParB family chromosome partitioning protein
MNKVASRRVLGKGLSSLIPVAASDEKTKEQDIVDVEYSLVKPNPFQPRREFDEQELQRLAESIDTQGLLQPILVRQKENREFEIISGERRYRALGLLGKKQVPCVVRQKVSDREMMEIALVENIQREDLNEIEKADGYHKLIIEHGYTHDELAKQMGKSRTAVTNSLRLLNLSDEIQNMVRKNHITMGHARALLAIADNTSRNLWAKKIVEEGLSVRDIEKKAQDSSSITQKKRRAAGEVKQDPDLLNVIERLRYKFGTSVAVKKGSSGRGEIVIDYFSEKDLTRIVDLLLDDKK